MSDRQKLTRAQAVEWIRKAPVGSSFYAHVSMDVLIEGNEEEYYRGGARLTVKLSRNDAAKMAKDYMTDKREAEGGRVPCCAHASGVTGMTHYWIG